MMPMPSTVDSTALGASVSVLAPIAVLVSPRMPHAWTVRVPFLPPLLVLGVHAVLMTVAPRPLGQAVVFALAAGVVFWLPVLGASPTLEPARRTLYLLVSGPALDLAALPMVAEGDSAAAIAMVVAMLPIPLAGVASFLLWMRDEERDAQAAASAETASAQCTAAETAAAVRSGGELAAQSGEQFAGARLLVAQPLGDDPRTVPSVR